MARGVFGFSRSSGYKWRRDRDRQILRLHGYAGSGKTTVAIEAGCEEPNVWFCALAGKAAARLVERGAPRDRTSTIHRLLYKSLPYEDEHGRIRFHVEKRQRHEFKHLNLIVVDEGSMVGNEVAQDLLNTGRPILAVGDPAQLPPPFASVAPFMARPHALLTEIHRQAGNSQILRLAEAVREGHSWEDLADGNEVKITKIVRAPEAADQNDIIICGKNTTRHRVNSIIRKHLGFMGVVPQVGERLLCKRNDRAVGCFNGELYEVNKSKLVVNGQAVDLQLTNLNFDANVEVRVPLTFFENGEPPDPEESLLDPNSWQHFEFGYCLTAHSAQGSEWDKCVIVNEARVFHGDSRRWTYTAVTRAKTNLTIATSVRE